MCETDLRWNNIGLLGGRSLLDALQQNRTVLQLEMAGNNIPSDILRAIGQIRSTHHSTEAQITEHFRAFSHMGFCAYVSMSDDSDASQRPQN